MFKFLTKKHEEKIKLLEARVFQLEQQNARQKRVLINVLNSAVHPETAYRAVMVNLEPIREVLKES